MTTTAAATFCATLVDEWVRAGVSDAFVSPGSRSTPLALALVATPGIAVNVFHDERAASFAALGHGLATGRPGIVLCSSGTAGTHFHAAVVEADLSGVPMVVCTADRPPELWDVAAPQTIDQTRLYGAAVRFFAEPGVPDADRAGTWRSFASRLVAEATGWRNRPGPVHTNLCFRDPLVGEPGPLPEGRPGGAPWHRVLPVATTGGPGSAHGSSGLDPLVAADLAGRLVNGTQARPGVIVAGRGTTDPAAVVDLAQRLGWPVVADHRSGCRVPGRAVRHADALLRVADFAGSITPEVVIRVGEPLTSKVLGQWLADIDAEVIAVLDASRWADPERVAGTVVTAPGALAALADALPHDLAPSPVGELWARADEAAAAAVEAALAASADSGSDRSEIVVARQAVEAVPAGGALVVSASMPVRDVEWFGPNRADITVHANRGANGIDGVVSTAIGVSVGGTPTVVLIGDVAFLHDSTALIGLASRNVDLHIVVVDNGGGGIFSFLPQAGAVEPATFEALFGTPHGTDLAALAAAHRLPVVAWPPPPGEAATGPRVSVVTTGDRVTNVSVHAAVNHAAATALEALHGAPAGRG